MVSTVKVSETVSTENVIDVHRYSSREKLVRVTAWIQRFAQNCKAKIRKTNRMTGGLTVEEIVSAEKLWIQTVQAGLKERTSFSQLVSQLGLVESEGSIVLQRETRRIRPLFRSTASNSARQQAPVHQSLDKAVPRESLSQWSQSNPG